MRAFVRLAAIAVGVPLLGTICACGGGGGGGSASAPPVATPAPTVSVSLSAAKTTVGSSVTLTWSATNATSCTGMDNSSGAKATSGTETITPTGGGQFKYTISCDGAGGTSKQTASLAVPMSTLPTSYENKLITGQAIGPQKLPDGLASGMKSNYEHVLAGIAYADFFQDGSYSMVVQSSDYTPVDPSKVPGGGQQFAPLVPGSVYFYKKDAGGNWVNNTAALLKNQTGCIQVRKILVADFNKDGKPDVFISCTGNDQGPGVGESSRVLISQPDGTYVNNTIGVNCYCHAATAMDINNDGYTDVVAWNNSELAGKMGPYVLLNNKDGTFTPRYDLLPTIVGTQNGVPIPWGASYWTMEAIDVNGDGKTDLIFAGKESNYVSATQADDRVVIYTNDGSGTFVNAVKNYLPAAPKGFNLTIDILFYKGNFYLFKIRDAEHGENVASTATGYVDQGVFKVDAKTMQGTMVFETNNFNNTIHSLSSWTIIFNDQITDMDAKYSSTKVGL